MFYKHVVITKDKTIADSFIRNLRLNYTLWETVNVWIFLNGQLSVLNRFIQVIQFSSIRKLDKNKNNQYISVDNQLYFPLF